ncbi:MAG: hypothetical protein OJF48_003002 [Afipia sp.]|nr:MAG: hypothetical protein OJF48_003002 [Afipia sp.]
MPYGGRLRLRASSVHIGGRGIGAMARSNRYANLLIAG